MSTFTVRTECGTTGDFESLRDAEAGKRTHEMLCEECAEENIHIEAAPEQSTLDERPGDVERSGDAEIAETPPEPADDDGDQLDETGETDEPRNSLAPGPRGPSPADVVPESVRTDPLDVVPEYMIDEVEGQPTINKRGYAVIANHFDIVVHSEAITTAGETDHEYAEFKATAWKRGDDPEEGYTGHATARASEDRRGMADNLNEMAETRAMKRAVAWASGVGILAWEEMAGYLDEGEA